MNDTSPETEAFLITRFAAMTGSERALMALQMFETAQQIVLSSLDPSLSELARRRELCRRFYGDALADAAYPGQTSGDYRLPQLNRAGALPWRPPAATRT